MRVGVVVDTPWTTDSAGAVGGIESALVRSLAEELSARIDWVRGGETQLLTALQHREMDLVIGGLTATSPWQQQVADAAHLTSQRRTRSVCQERAPRIDVLTE